ncbi:TetR family transcriptional regulator [Virgibacillus sp. NKC19-16]|uniref:TetR/AcrR family transcriptional regulator n=1 Tax=Virgibacillus salidurans TaxID=2831673 RepID=UPI001F2438E7|nr:TetR/AcrR family transcriptional regulator [Virgibacillus sp. NKC19-16]UJL45544.1 TetR family transcriptional regulator [Virgibacillus sp. NKC19-16]
MKEKITEQSILLFEKKGFSVTSIQDIVNELGVTKGTFYYYFNSKEQLLMDIHYDYITSLLKRQEEIMNNNNLSQKDKLIENIRLIITDIVERGPSARVFFREMRHLTDENIEKIKQKREQIRLNFEKVIQIGIDNVEFNHSLQVDMVAFGIVGMTNWSYNWYQPDGKITPDELVTIYADMVLGGIQN